jgi:lysophospholipase L1-like esterase
MAVGNLRWLTWLAAALAISLAGALLSFWVLRMLYENRLRRQIWTDSAPETTVISNGSAGLGPTVLLLGDSRMAQWELPQLPRWQVINAGTGGLTTAQIRLAAPTLLDQFHPEVVVVQVGINDLKFLGLRPDMASQVVSLALSNITATVQESAKRHRKCILLTTWPAGQPGLARSLVWSEAVSAAVGQLNGQLQRLDSAEKGIRVVDLFKEAGLKPEAEFYRDGLHLKPAAYQRLTPLLQRELDQARPIMPPTKN